MDPPLRYFCSHDYQRPLDVGEKQQRLGRIEMVLRPKDRRTELLRLRESDLPEGSSHSEV